MLVNSTICMCLHVVCDTNLGMSKHLPVKVEDFPEHVALMQSDDSIRFEREYEKITVDIPFSQHAAKLYVNALKNRYKNIIPCELIICSTVMWYILYAVFCR